MILAIMNDGKMIKISFETAFDLLTNGNYKYVGYNKEKKGHEYTQKKINNGYPITIIDKQIERRF